MKRRLYATTAVSGALALFLAGPAWAGSVDELQARKAALLQELEAVDAELASEGITIAPAGSMTPTPGASEGITGYGGLFGGVQQRHGFESSGSTQAVVPVGGVAIGANMPLGGGWNAGLDGFGAGSDTDDGQYFNAWGGGGVHLFWRDPDYAVGVFGSGFGAFELGGGSDNGTLVAGGIEAALFYPNSTIVFQGGYLSRISGVFGIESDNDLISNGMAFRAQNRWFLGDDSRLDVGVVGAWGQAGTDQNEEGIGGLELEFEHKPSGWPFSIFAGGIALAGMEDDDSDDKDVGLYYSAGIGVRMYFGHETLKSNDRNGVTFKSLPVTEINALAADF